MYKTLEIVAAICDNPKLGKLATVDHKGKRICNFVLRRVHYRVLYKVERKKRDNSIKSV